MRLLAFVVAAGACLTPVVSAQVKVVKSDAEHPATYIIPLRNGERAARGEGHVSLRIQLPGREPERVLVDTGSVGLILPADELGHPKGTPGFIRYSSSGIGYKGVWAKVRVGFPEAMPGDAHGIAIAGAKPGAIAEVEVFSAKERTCDEGTAHSNCAEVMKKPIGVHMLGIGFGRAAAFATPEHNPLLQLAPMVTGAMRRSYLFRGNKELVSGFMFEAVPEKHCVGQRLKPFDAHTGDWQTPSAKITINGKSFEGTALVDTGISDMLIAAEGFPSSGLVAKGTTVGIDLLGDKFPEYRLSYKIGDDDHVPTRTAHWVRLLHGPYINTGYGPLAQFDYFFDGTNGSAGFCQQ
ncbi:MAG: hypothetical protein JSS87_09550 [Acidobacteria bacterium]|nr:hypothetical protein [Acidobacteriota bacterium]